jgi:hypothetical protein
MYLERTFYFDFFDNPKLSNFVALLDLEGAATEDANADARPFERDRRAPLEKDRELLVSRELAVFVRCQPAVLPLPNQELLELSEGEVFEGIK